MKSRFLTILLVPILSFSMSIFEYETSAKNTYLPYIILLISGLLFYHVIKKFRRIVRLVNTGIRTKAKVIDIKEDRGRDSGTNNFPILQYTDWENNTVTFEPNSTSRSYRIGDTVSIIYSKDGKERRINSIMGLYVGIIIIFFIALFLFMVGLSGAFDGGIVINSN